MRLEVQIYVLDRSGDFLAVVFVTNMYTFY